MRIMFAITRGEVGGAQEHVRILATALASDGHDVGLLVEHPSALAASLGGEDIDVFAWRSIERNVDPRSDLAARRELKEAVRTYRPDILHLHSAKAGLLGRGLRREHSAIVYTCHHAAFGPGRQWSHRIVARPAEQVSLGTLDGIISVGARDVPLLRKLAPRTPIRLIRNAVPWKGQPLSPELPGPHALWVARMRRPKDPLQVVAAWERVTKVVSEAQLTMCGGGPLAEKLRARIARSPARANITYHGQVPSLAEHQRQATLFVLATDVEGGITMATLEAMTHGLVSIVSDAGDAWLHEVFGTGVVVPTRSPGIMAEATTDLLRDPQRVVMMRRRAIEYARTSWTIDDMFRSTVDFYRFLQRK